MQKFMKTILSAVKTWTQGKIKDSTADWNQNDPNADNYVKNRTHWEEYKEASILKSTRVDTSSQSFIDMPPVSSLVIGQEYVVTYDGIKYNCIAYLANDGGIAIGNGDLFFFDPSDNGNDEPFFFVNYEPEASLIFSANPGIHTISIDFQGAVIHKLDSKFLDLPTNVATTDYAMAKNNPEGTGSFSMNRNTDYNSGEYSRATGNNTAAIGDNSSADGFNTIATRKSQNVIGEFNINETTYHCDVEPIYQQTVAVGGNYVFLGSKYRIYELEYDPGVYYFDVVDYKYVETRNASFYYKDYPYVLDLNSRKIMYRITQVHSTTNYQITFTGEKYTLSNGIPKRGEYVHIVGNGTSDDARSNAHTLDWNGNAWYQGDVYVGGTSQKDGAKKVLTLDTYIPLYDSSTGALYKIEIKDGNLVSSLIASTDDFTYTINDDGTRTITGWNETYLGEPSTEMIIPDDGAIL